MKGDFTRLTFDKKKHYRGVLMQQGRVQLDSDWNEQVQIAEYRYSTFLGDFVGQSGAPAGDAMAFSQQSSDALDLGDKTFITVSQLSSSLTGKSSATVQFWFRTGSVLSMDLKKDAQRATTRCIVSLDEIAGFGVMSDGSPSLRFMSESWQKMEIGKNINQINDGDWHFLAVVVGADAIPRTTYEIVVYLDGRQIAQRSGSPAAGSEKKRTVLNTLVLGAWGDNKTYYFGGDVADLRIWNGEIESPGAMPASALTGKEKGLIRYYPLNEKDKATSAADLSSSKKNAKITGTVTRCDGPFASGEMRLGKGRYYVDGLLVENESEIDVAQPSKNGLYLAYLDVWGRHICAAEDETLLEPALGGPDTTTRIKTQWQLRCRYLGAKNAFTLDEIRKRYCGVWPQLFSPDAMEYWQLPLSTGRMKIDSTNFTPTENQLYRVEVHTGNFNQDGEEATLKFKWSRDNGSITATVKDINSATKIITLADANLNIRNSFSDAGLIEISDEVCSRTGAPGYLVSVDMSLIRDGKITLKENWGYERSAANLEAPIIVRRWDGVQTVKNFELEDGLTVTFDDGDVFYRSGDYWLIPARAGGVMGWENDVPQPAQGVEHHFAALALIIKETKKCAFENLSMIFQPLITGNVSKGGDIINGDLSVMGRLSVGSSIFSAPLSVNADTVGNLISLKASDETWRVSQGKDDTPSLGITDGDGNGLIIRKGGNIGIGTMPTAKLEISGADNGHADVAVKGRLRSNSVHGGGMYLDSEDCFMGSDSKGGIGFTTSGNRQLVIDKDGKVGVGTNNPAARLEIAGGTLYVSRDADRLEIDPWVGSNGTAISFVEKGEQKANLYWNKHSQTFHVNSAGASNTSLNVNGGNVGVGTSQPQARLHIKGENTSAFILECPGDAYSAQQTVKAAGFPRQTVLIGGYVCESCIHIYWKDQNGRTHMGIIEATQSL